MQRTHFIPNFGVTGYSGGSTYGTLNTYGGSSTYQGTTTLTPTYGVTGFVPTVVSQQVYVRRGSLSVYRVAAANSRPQEVFRARLTSSGTCSMLSKLAPIFIVDLAKDFPKNRAEILKTPFDFEC